MAHIEKQRGKYRARFSDPVGKIQSRTFERKADAERFLRQVDADRVRGQWVDPAIRTRRSRSGPRSSCRLSAAVADDGGDLPARSRQVRAAPIRRVPARAATSRRDRELVERRGRCRHRPIVGSSPLPDPSPHAAGRRAEAEDPDEPV